MGHRVNREAKLASEVNFWWKALSSVTDNLPMASVGVGVGGGGVGGVGVGGGGVGGGIEMGGGGEATLFSRERQTHISAEAQVEPDLLNLMQQVRELTQ